MIYEYGTTFKYLLWNYFYLELSYFSGFPVVNDPLYNHVVFGPEKGKGGRIGKSDEKLIEVTYESPILGQLLDLISPAKINLCEPRFKSYEAYLDL